MLRDRLAIRIYLVVVLAMLTLVTSCTPAETPSGTVIKIEPSVSSVQVNDTFMVPIKVQNIADLTAIEIHLSFNAAMLEVMELTDGGFIKADFIVQNTFDNAAGTVDYAVAQIDRAPVNGSGTLFEIVFRAKASGDSPIGFRETQAAPAGALLADSTGMAIQISLINGSVSISK